MSKRNNKSINQSTMKKGRPAFVIARFGPISTYTLNLGLQFGGFHPRLDVPSLPSISLPLAITYPYTVLRHNLLAL